MNFDLNLGALDEGKLIKLDESELYDVLIVGTGPAAVASAVYAVRKGLKTAMIGTKIGGQVLDTNEIENVIVTNEKGDKLNTEHLIWDEKKQKLLSNEDVKITTKDEIIFGKGFEANEDFTKYKIFNIKGTISINNPKND